MGLPQQTGLKEEVVWYAGRATRVLVCARTVSVSRKPGAIPYKGHPNMQKKLERAKRSNQFLFLLYFNVLVRIYHSIVGIIVGIFVGI
jgi:hypothetical protein